MFPSKVVSVRDSILWKLPDLEETIGDSINILDLYSKIINLFDDINDFLISLDILYLLEKIEIDYEEGKIIYVKGNNM